MASSQDERPLIHRFGEFEVNPYTRQLLRAGRPVPIQPKPLDLLLYLIRERSRVVPRDEILAAVWQGVRVEAQALGFALHAVRKAVGDDGNRQCVIRTVSRSGLQFVAEVEDVVAPLESRSVPFGSRAFLGRDRLMADARALLDEVEQGQGRILLLSGEAGIGKTRALEAIGELAEARGFRVFRGACVESEGAPAFWPWIQILRAAVDSDPPSGLLQALSEGAREVAWMVPELRPYVRDLPDAPSMDARAARFLLFDSVTTFLEALGAGAPHLLCIDDLHRADAASVALLSHVARELGGEGAPRLCVVGAYRDTELRVAQELVPTLTAVTSLRHGSHERLRGLEREDVRALVGGVSGQRVSEAAVSELHRKTNGNPFFLHQILRVLEKQERLTALESPHSLDLALPPQVQDTIRQQLRALSEDLRNLLALAAAIGREFQLGDLEVATGRTRYELLALLDQAVAARIVESGGEEVSGYRFVHALVRDAIYSGLSLETRSRHHGAIARALASRSTDRPGPESAALAHHHENSSLAGDAEKAIRFYELAAAWATEKGAFEDAPPLLDRALKLLSTFAPPTEARRCRLMLELGDALTNAGIRGRAREVLQAAAGIAKRDGLPEELARAALRFAPDFLAIEVGVYDPDLVRLLEAAIASCGASVPDVRARLLARLAIAVQWDHEDLRRSEKLRDEAVAIASRSDLPQTRKFVETAARVIGFSLVEPERQVKVAVDPTSSDVSLELLQRLLRITSLLILGRVREADGEVQRFSELAESSRHPQGRWYVDLVRATRAQMEGRHEEAVALSERFLALGRKHGDRNALHSYEAQYVMRAFDVGNVDPHEQRLRAMVDAFPRMVAWRAGLVLVLVELGRTEDARSEFRRIVSGHPLQQLRPTEWYVTAATLALACGVLGEPETAANLYSDLLPHADQLVVFGYCTYCAGSAQRLLGALATGMKRWSDAIGHYEASISRNSEVGAHGSNARVLYEYARTLRAAGKNAEAAMQARRAMKAAERFGMRRLVSLSERLI